MKSRIEKNYLRVESETLSEATWLINHNGYRDHVVVLGGPGEREASWRVYSSYADWIKDQERMSASRKPPIPDEDDILFALPDFSEPEWLGSLWMVLCEAVESHADYRGVILLSSGVIEIVAEPHSRCNPIFANRSNPNLAVIAAYRALEEK